MWTQTNRADGFVAVVSGMVLSGGSGGGQVEVGQEVAQGTLLGTVGSTGRATGAHLHWGVYWFDQAVDPALLVGPMPNPLG